MLSCTRSCPAFAYLVLCLRSRIDFFPFRRRIHDAPLQVPEPEARWKFIGRNQHRVRRGLCARDTPVAQDLVQRIDGVGLVNVLPNVAAPFASALVQDEQAREDDENDLRGSKLQYIIGGCNSSCN